jgi:Acyclic terpene utilisation family protein AtuA
MPPRTVDNQPEQHTLRLVIRRHAQSSYSSPIGERDRAVRIANCSGFYGDRLSAAREMVDGGPIDFLTGDWLAELTMLILAKGRRRDPSLGYARTFLQQMEDVLGTCMDRGIKVVANAGGLNPGGCADALERIAADLGLSPRVASVTGDDILPRLNELRGQGHTFDHLDTGQPLGNQVPLTANAYIGCWGIVAALQQEADIVITGRTTDASVVMGPAAWWHGWQAEDFDQLAGACVAGHVIECGCQCTGGNYSFFTEVPGLEHPGFPIAEIHPDGSSVITKHPGTGGLVSVGTVTAQLLYEVGSPLYLNSDVVARFDSIELEQVGPDQVRIGGVKGDPPPSDLKVGINYEGGARNSIRFLLTGLEVEAKAELIERTLRQALERKVEDPIELTTELVRGDHPDPQSNRWALAELIATVKATDANQIGRRFAAAGIEMALASYPGFYTAGPPSEAQTYGVYWPALLSRDLVPQLVTVGGTVTTVPPTGPTSNIAETPPISPADAQAEPADGPTVMAPLGRVVGARSGDKGGNANVGLWARTDDAYTWLRSFLSVERLAELFPETRSHPVQRFEFPNLLALNFVIVGLLGEGVAASTRVDPQAKGLGEYLRAREVPVPRHLLD